MDLEEVRKALSKEAQAFEKMRDDLVEKHDGKYAIIHGEQLIAVFDTREEAYEAAMTRFGRGTPFLLKRIAGTDEELVAPALALGLLDAKPV